MGENPTDGPGPDPERQGATAQPTADADQKATIDKMKASDAVDVKDGPSEASRSVLQPNDGSHIQANVTRTDSVADDVSVGARSNFSVGLNVCLEPQ